MSQNKRAIIVCSDDGPGLQLPVSNQQCLITLAGRPPRRKILVNESAQRIRTPVPS